MGKIINIFLSNIYIIVLFYLFYVILLSFDRLITKEEFLKKSVPKHSSTGMVSNESESKANIAFKIFDENHDGFITEKEMRNHSKITKTQVNV